MKLSRIIAELGPQLIQHQIEAIEAAGGNADQWKLMAPLVINAITDMFLDRETHEKNDGKAHFVAHVAADMLRTWPGEPSAANVDSAVKLAKRLVDKAEEIVTSA